MPSQSLKIIGKEKPFWRGQWGKRRFVQALLFLSLSLFLAPLAQAEEQPIRIGITPCTDIIKTFKIFQPLVSYLEYKLNRPVTLVIPRDFYEFESAVKEQKVDFAYQAPHTYVRLADHYNKQQLLKALTPEGDIVHRGVVIVRKDSPIQSLADLKGKIVMFGSELSTAKCLATKELLRSEEINFEKDLRRYIHDGSCESIALNVYLKAVDAGAVCDYSFEEINAPAEEGEVELPPGQLRVIAETMLIPTWVFSAVQATDKELITRVFHLLQELDRENEQHEQILEAAEIGGFVPAQDGDFDEVRNLAQGAQ